MPSVPRYGVAQTQEVLGPNIRVREEQGIESFGGGRGLAQVGGALENLTESVMDRADEIAVMEAERKLNDWETQFLYNPGEDDGTGVRKNQGAFYKRGKDAFEVPKMTNEAFSKIQTEIISGMSGPRQKAIFEQRALQKKQMIDRQIQKHVGNEIEKYQADTFKSYMQSERQSAINTYQDPKAVKKSIIRQKEEIQKFGENQGWDAETMKLNIQMAESQTHAGVISRMVANGDDLTAETYYKENKDLIVHGREKVEEVVRESSSLGFVQRFTDDVMKKGLDEKAALKEASKIENPRLRELAESKIPRVYGQQRQADYDREMDIVTRLATEFDKTGSVAPKNANMIAGLRPETKAKLEAHINRNPLRDDGVLYSELYKMASDPESREKFAAYELTKDLPNLSGPRFEKLLALQKNIREGKDSVGKELDGAFSDLQIMQRVYKSAGLGDNKEKIAKYELKVNSSIARAKKEKGRNLTDDEVQNIANQYVSEMVVPWGLDKPLYEMDDISDKDRERVVQGLKATGKPVNEANILKAYILTRNQSGK